MCICYLLYFFNDPATTEIYTLSLHDALPICRPVPRGRDRGLGRGVGAGAAAGRAGVPPRLPAHRPRDVLRVGPADVEAGRSEEHTSELQSRQYLVCRLLLEKKIKIYHSMIDT